MKTLQFHGILTASENRKPVSVKVYLGDHYIISIPVGKRQISDYNSKTYDGQIAMLIEDVVAEWLTSRIVK